MGKMILISDERLEVHMRRIPVLYIEKKECCGCTACYSICSQGAIYMEEDEEGFEYPHIDEVKCITCYQCVRVCPLMSGG